MVLRPAPALSGLPACAQGSSHLQLPLQSLHLPTEGLHLRAAWGCRLALQRFLKTEDLLGELCDLGREWEVSAVAWSP